MPDRRSDARVSVVVPCYNEEPTVEAILARVLQQPMVGEVIVVDDGSKDRTAELVAKLASEEPRVQLIRQPRNLGKGAALRRGLGEASCDFVIIQDADLEYDPADYDKVLAPLLDGRADVCFGSRFQSEGARRVLYYWHSVGNGLLTMVSNMATNLNLTDMETCYKAFRREVVQSLLIEEDRFGFEPEVTAKVAKAGHRIYETGISYAGRTYEEGKKIGWRDGVHAFRCIARYNLWPGADGPAPRHEPARSESADEELAKVLATLETAGNYADWVMRLFEPYLGERVLEIGAGHGTMTARLAQRARVTATDPQVRCRQQLERAFEGDERVSVEPLDLVADDPEGSYDTVVMANVLEHLPDDVAALAKVREVLRPGGTVLVYSPALDVLYSRLDRRIGHYRRYRRHQLGHVARQAGLVVGELRYVNPLGALGWLVLVRGLGQFPDTRLLDRYNRSLVPRLERLEARWRPPFGQSLFLAAHRPLG